MLYSLTVILAKARILSYYYEIPTCVGMTGEDVGMTRIKKEKWAGNSRIAGNGLYYWKYGV